jgi:hypothetical protein
VTRYSAVLIANGSTLDVLLRKSGLLRAVTQAPLAGRMMALLDLASRLPWRVRTQHKPKPAGDPGQQLTPIGAIDPN